MPMSIEIPDDVLDQIAEKVAEILKVGGESDLASLEQKVEELENWRDNAPDFDEFQVDEWNNMVNENYATEGYVDSAIEDCAGSEAVGELEGRVEDLEVVTREMGLFMRVVRQVFGAVDAMVKGRSEAV